jgi:hypothetical protein
VAASSSSPSLVEAFVLRPCHERPRLAGTAHHLSARAHSLTLVELDEHGREVRHRPPPGHRVPELDEAAWPDLENSPYTPEGRIEQAGVLARGLRRRVSWVRVIGVVVAVVMLVPIVINTIAIAFDAMG